jgi:hypothetical protein
MTQVGFEPKIPLFEREKGVHSLHRATTVIGSLYKLRINKYVVSHSRIYQYSDVVMLEVDNAILQTPCCRRLTSQHPITYFRAHDTLFSLFYSISNESEGREDSTILPQFQRLTIRTGFSCSESRHRDLPDLWE